MPKYWYDRNANRSCDVPDEEEREFRLRVLADKKPYFMKYIYPTLSKQNSTYITNTKKKCLREFRITIDELLDKPESELTEEESNFLYYYRAKMPVGTHRCVMNRVCWRFEQEFDHYIAKYPMEETFDYTLMQSGEEYTKSQFNTVEAIYGEYVARVREFSRYSKVERVDRETAAAVRSMIVEDFRRQCFEACSYEDVLCDILLDICYQREGTKQLAWDVVGHVMVRNLLRRNGWRIFYPVASESGEVSYAGERFTFVPYTLKEEENSDSPKREGFCGEGDPRECPWEEAD